MRGILIVFICVGIKLGSGIQDLGHLCDGLLSLDCATQYIKGEDDETVCGSDGMTYDNFCYYSQQRCKDHTMVMVSTGACPGSAAGSTVAGSGSTTMMMTSMGTTVAGVTTMAPTTTTGAPTPDPLLEVFCQTKDTVTCQQDLDPICGSDKKFYLNQCEFSKAYCDNNSLVSKDIAFCTGR